MSGLSLHHSKNFSCAECAPSLRASNFRSPTIQWLRYSDSADSSTNHFSVPRRSNLLPKTIFATHGKQGWQWWHTVLMDSPPSVLSFPWQMSNMLLSVLEHHSWGRQTILSGSQRWQHFPLSLYARWERLYVSSHAYDQDYTHQQLVTGHSSCNTLSGSISRESTPCATIAAWRSQVIVPKVYWRNSRSHWTPNYHIQTTAF